MMNEILIVDENVLSRRKAGRNSFESKVSVRRRTSTQSSRTGSYGWARKSPGENFSGWVFFWKLLKSTHYPSGWLGCALWFLSFFHPCHGTIRPRMGRMKANTQTHCENFLPKTICTPRSREDLEVLIWLLEFAMKVLSSSGIYSHSFAQFALNISEQMQTHSYLTLFHLNITARS